MLELSNLQKATPYFMELHGLFTLELCILWNCMDYLHYCSVFYGIAWIIYIIALYFMELHGLFTVLH